MDCNRNSSSQSNKSGMREEIRWDNLPPLVIFLILAMLKGNDRKNASEVCRNWRREFFHPKFWPAMSFRMRACNLEESRFLINVFASSVKYANIYFETFSSARFRELFELLEKFAENNNLKYLSIGGCEFYVARVRKWVRWPTLEWSRMQTQFEMCLPRLTVLIITIVGILPFNVNWILEKLNPKSLKTLILRSSCIYPPFNDRDYFNPQLLEPFVSLEILNINYGNFSEEVLEQLRICIKSETLRRLRRWPFHQS